jgi:hypothetical protein
MGVASIICTVKKFLKVAADEVPFVHDGGTIVIAQRAP